MSTQMYSISTYNDNPSVATSYASTSAMAAVDMTNQFDGVRTFVTNTGAYKYHKQATTGNVAATGGGYWNLIPDQPVLLLNDSNQIDGSQIEAVGSVTLSDGTAAAPSLAFASSPSTGAYYISSNSIGLSTNGTLRVTLSTTGLTSTLPVRGPNGGPTAPAYSFSGETNTGWYLGAAANMSLAIAGSLKANFTATALNLVSGSAYQIDGTQVVQARATGWTNSAGTATQNQGAINADTITATDGNVQLLAKWLKGLTAALITHGLIGT